MCNIGLLLGLLITAQTSFMVPLALTGMAVSTSSNLFTSGASPAGTLATV